MARKQAKREYVIIGLDSFGENLALALQALGHEVLGIDRDRATVQRLADNIQDLVVLDATDYETLLSIGLDAFDTAIVAIGGDLAQAVLTTLTLKELGIRRVVCEAQSERDRRALLRVGADEVMTPAIESARAVAYQLTNQNVRADRLRLANQLVVKWQPRAGYVGTIGELMAPHGEALQVLLLVGRDAIYNPGPETPVSHSDELLLAGPEQAIAALLGEFGNRV
ncbi:TrkA family potassium uptake protein [Promineifilum sp.]|uniref:potassium channel family protein n=1 Tax=Promineifilum sp. TaxID=2664178 RepID=UPI0035B4C160